MLAPADIRAGEVQEWIAVHGQGRIFVIIDDNGSLHNLPSVVQGRWAETSPLIGLTDEGVTRATGILETPFVVECVERMEGKVGRARWFPRVPATAASLQDHQFHEESVMQSEVIRTGKKHIMVIFFVLAVLCHWLTLNLTQRLQLMIDINRFVALAWLVLLASCYNMPKNQTLAGCLKMPERWRSN